MPTKTNVILNGRDLTIEQVMRVAADYAKVTIATDALEDVIDSQVFITNQVELGNIVYGVTTGFGINADKVIERKDAALLQRNLLISHATGVGNPFEETIVRAIMVIRLNTLLAGHSGVRLETIRLLQQFLNYKIHPFIPEQGSVGASGDLCPLSHMALPLMGEGLVVFQNQRMTTKALYDLPEIQSINTEIEEKNTAVFSELEKMPLIAPIELSYKEGIGLSNGTTAMVALGVVAIHRTEKMLDLALKSNALMMEGYCARTQAMDSKIHAVRRHDGQAFIAKKIRTLLDGSTLFGIRPLDILRHFPPAILLETADLSFLKNTLQKQYDHLKVHIETTNDLEIQLIAQERLQEIEQLLAIQTPTVLFKLKHLKAVLSFIPQLFCDFLLENSNKNLPQFNEWKQLIIIAKKKITPQDAYSIRCVPQVFGASWTALTHARQVISQELNAVVDNPIIFLRTQVLPDGQRVLQNDVLSGGNFHGQPIALVLDYLKLAVAEVGNIMERQINKLVDANTSDGLPPFLIENAGINSGLMIPQYTAAALVSENKVLVHPASADSIPTSANQEDHVSMGPIAGRQALQILENVKKVVAIHLLTAKQAVALRKRQFANKVPVQMSAATQALFDELEEIGISTIDEDRFLWQDIDTILDFRPLRF